MMNDKNYLILENTIKQLGQIDYGTILSTIVLSAACNYTVAKAFQGYTLRKDYRPKNITQVALPPELKEDYDSINILDIYKKDFGETIIKFATTLINRFPPEVLTNFYNNINTLKTKEGTFVIRNFLVGNKAVGRYDPKRNTIKIDGENEDITIFHELFHMASSIYKDGIEYSGFCQINKKMGTNIGVGINEGYTELLAERYFGERDTRITNSYQYQKFIVKQLEKIVGEEKMESLYFNSNLKGLIEELSQYDSEEEIMKFISNTDFLVKHLDDKKFISNEADMIGNCLKNVHAFLITNYMKSVEEKVDKGILSPKEASYRINHFIGEMIFNLTIHKHRYNLLEKEDLKNCIETVYGKKEAYSSK